MLLVLFAVCRLLLIQKLLAATPATKQKWLTKIEIVLWFNFHYCFVWHAEVEVNIEVVRVKVFVLKPSQAG